MTEEPADLACPAGVKHSPCGGAKITTRHKTKKYQGKVDVGKLDKRTCGDT